MSNKIEIFKTNIKKQYASYVIQEMQEHFPTCRISIDTGDRDKVLRVENKKGNVEPTRVINLLKKRNFHCEVLND
jgi:hypothetical protein